MGKHLDKIKKIDNIIGKIQKAIEELNNIARTTGEKGKPDRELSLFVTGYAYLNYQFSVYLINRLSKAVNKDKIDKEFNNIMEHFNNGKKKLKDDKNKPNDDKKKGFLGWWFK